MIDQTRPEPDHKKTGVNYERLGKAVEDALILDYIYVLHSTRRQVWSAFIRGTPVIGQFFQDLGQTIENRHQ
jgi:hypothetical protein